jgi:hypothetical protein
MSFISGMGVGAGPASGLRFANARTQGRIGGAAAQGVNYPSPFFDIAHTYYPTTVKALFRWCRYYFLTNPIINATSYKLSEYPITDIIIDHENPQVVKRWTEYFQDHLRYRAFQVECGLDYHVFGNAALSIGFPFKKFLECRRCKWREAAQKSRGHWIYTSNAFRLTCPGCGHIGDATASDVYFKNASGIRMLRWNPEDLEISYNPITGEYVYFYNIPAPIKNDITIGRKEIVDSLPQVFLQAMKENKGVIFSKENFFHLKRATIADQDRGWGIPLLLPVLKDVFYRQIMKKAQEAILLEHIVPLRVLFPQPASGTSDPYTTINLVDWRDHVAQEIARWRLDNNYIPIMPLPLGNQTIGGDGKALLLNQEMMLMDETIMNGMQVPVEFIKGGMSYAGTNVSMRMLENQFIGYTLSHKALARFIMKSVASYLDWPEANIRFKPFKMADDIQRKAYLFQLNQANKVSDKTLLADADLSQEEEDQTMLNEADSRLTAMKKQQLAMAEIQGEAQMTMMKYQVKAQQEQQKAMMAGAAQGEPGGPDAAAAAAGAPAQPQAQAQTMDGMTSPLGMGQQMPMNQQGQFMGINIDLPTMAQAQANMIQRLPPNQQQFALNNLRAQSPELAQLVEQLLKQMGGEGGEEGQPGVDMRPLPEARSPRRAAGMV